MLPSIGTELMRRATCIRKVNESIKANLLYHAFETYATELKAVCPIFCDLAHGLGYSYARIERAFDTEIKSIAEYLPFELRWPFNSVADYAEVGIENEYSFLKWIIHSCRKQSEFSNKEISYMRREAEAERELLWDKYCRYRPMTYKLGDVWGKEAA